MAHEPVADEGRKDRLPDKWKPALKAGAALIGALVVILVFNIITILLLYTYLRPIWMIWQITGSNMHPLYTAIFEILSGGVLLALAGFLITKNGWHEALFNGKRLTLSGPAINYFMIGLVVGACAAVALKLLETLSYTYLFNGFLHIGLLTENLAIAALLIVPRLLLSIGRVALIQGYFQRTISKNYGPTAGLITAALLYALLSNFPAIGSLLYSPQYIVYDFIIGLIVAYLFDRSGSIFMPVGFSFAWDLFPPVFGGFVSVAWFGPYTPLEGSPLRTVTYLLQAFIALLTLALILYFGHRSRGTPSGLAGSLKNVVNFFRFHDE